MIPLDPLAWSQGTGLENWIAVITETYIGNGLILLPCRWTLTSTLGYITPEQAEIETA